MAEADRFLLENSVISFFALYTCMSNAEWTHKSTAPDDQLMGVG